MDERKNLIPEVYDTAEQQALAEEFSAKKISALKSALQGRPSGSVKIRDSKYTFIKINENEFYLLLPLMLGAGTSGIINKAWRIVDHSGLATQGLLDPKDASIEFHPIAMKILHPEAAPPQAETKALHALSDPEVAHTNFFGVNKIFMRYIPGKQLIDDDNVLDESIEQLSFAQRVNVVAAILQKIKNIHDLGWAHCDIKGHNIKFELDEKNQKPTIYILDFGSARKLDPKDNFIVDPSTRGTPRYMSPERDADIVTASTDIFAIAQDIPTILGNIDLKDLESKEQVSLILHNFIAKMQSVFTQERPTAAQALQFFKDFSELCAPIKDRKKGFFSESLTSQDVLIKKFLEEYKHLLQTPEKTNALKK